VPGFEFRSSKTDSIHWTFDRAPAIGEEIVLGDRGVYRVIGVNDFHGPYVEAEYAVVRVRDSTREEVREQLARGVNRLPPLG
jgi:hypothetical protein